VLCPLNLNKEPIQQYDPPLTWNGIQPRRDIQQTVATHRHTFIFKQGTFYLAVKIISSNLLTPLFGRIKTTDEGVPAHLGKFLQ
jgi:hypothetical protein